MSPAAHWTPEAYYAARDAARRAWELTDQQLSLGALDDLSLTADSTPRTGEIVERVPCLPLLNGDALHAGVGPGHAKWPAVTQRPDVTGGSHPSPTPPINKTGPGRAPHPGMRGRGQTGAS